MFILECVSKGSSPTGIFLAYLFFANEKQDQHQEIYELISEAKLFDISIRLPTIVSFKEKFNIYGKDQIHFGVKDIKSLAGKTGDKLKDAVELSEEQCGKPIKDFTWLDILIFFGQNVNSTTFKTLASIGFFRGIKEKVSRNKALYDYDIFRLLTKAELKWITTNYKDKKWETFIQCLTDLAPTKKEGGGTSKIDRKQIIENEIQLIENPPYDLEDDAGWIIDQETKFLGCPITVTKVETADNSAANTTCREILDGKKGQDLCIVANIQRMSDYTIKKGESKGKLMSFLTIEDDTCMLDSVVIFPRVREKYKYVLYEGNNLILCGSVTGEDTSLIINKIHEV